MDRITSDVRVRWGQPCLRDTGTSVAHVIALQREGLSNDEILERCPGLTGDDLDAAYLWHHRYCDWGLLPRPPDPGPDHPRVTVDPDVQGGYPVITGTRVTVDAVVGMWEEGFGVEDILEEFPGLAIEDVDDALAYDIEARTRDGTPVSDGPYDGGGDAS